MKERPILFNSEMVRAILRDENPKTQTRRPVDFKRIVKESGCTRGKLAWSNLLNSWAVYDGSGPEESAHIAAVRCPFGSVGDRLWVRETFYNDIPGERDLEHVYYHADGECCQQIPECQCASVGPTPWKPSIHMPRWASRITLEITNVRVERLRDISLADVFAEGCCLSTDKTNLTDFQNLWDSIYGNWNENPFVWAITFKKL